MLRAAVQAGFNAAAKCKTPAEIALYEFNIAILDLLHEEIKQRKSQ